MQLAVRGVQLSAVAAISTSLAAALHRWQHECEKHQQLLIALTAMSATRRLCLQGTVCSWLCAASSSLLLQLSRPALQQPCSKQALFYLLAEYG